MRDPRSRRRNRSGAAVVEAAFVIPVFLTLFFVLMGTGHLYMVDRLLKTACRQAARYGSAEGVTSAEVETHVRNVLSSAINADFVDVIVKDAGVYDDSTGTLPQTAEEYAALDDIEVFNALPRQMFLVRATLNYADVAIISLPGLGNSAVLVGQAITRHE